MKMGNHWCMVDLRDINEEEISACIDLSVPQSRQMRIRSPIEERVTAE